MDKTIIQDYGKYLSKVNPEKGRRRAQEQEAKWAEERKKREEEKLTEAYQRELRERAEQAARERRKVEKATAAFNAEQERKGTRSNQMNRRELRQIREGVSNIANPTLPFKSPDELMARAIQANEIRRNPQETLPFKPVNQNRVSETGSLAGFPRVERTSNINQGLFQPTGDIIANNRAIDNLTVRQPEYREEKKLPEVKPSDRYNNQNIRTEQKKSKRDTRFDSDFDRFYEYRYEKADFTDYDPKTDTTVEHWRNLKEDIKKKNKWSDKEFEDRWKAYDKERAQQAADSEVQTALDIAEKHPVLGTLLQAAYTPQGMIEGAASALSNLLPDEFKAQSADDPLFTGTRSKEGIRQTVKDEHINSDLGRGAYDLATGLGDMLLAQGIPVLGTAALGGNAAANTNMQALERGVDPNSAAKTGAVAGVASGLLNRVGLDAALGSEASTALRTIGKAALKEGAENVLEDVTNLTADKLINKDMSQLNTLHDYYVGQGMSDDDAWKRAALDTAKNLGLSAATGAAFGGLMSAAGNIPRLKADFTASRTQEQPIEALGDTTKATSAPNVKKGIDPTDNVKPTSVGDSAPTNNYTSSVEKAIDGYREALSWYDNKDIHPTSRKSIDRLKTALDKVAESAKAGDNAKFRENYDEFRKALTRVNENMAEKDGVDYFRDAFKGDINPKSEQNLMKLYDDAMYQKGLDDLDIDEDGFIIPKENEDLPFNEIEYDKYGRVMLDDEGIPKRRRGVDVGSSIRNMDARFDDDVLTSEQKLSRVRGNTLERAGIDNEQELADIIPEEDFTYWTQPEKTTYAAAENRLATDWQGSLEKYTKDYTEKSASDIRSAEDVDAMMLMRNRLNEMARNTDDPVEKRRLYEESRKVALNLRKAGTEAGRNVQAFAKWTRTPEGTITSAQGFAEDLVEKELKKNPKLNNEINQVSRQIESWLDEMETDALSRQEIEDMISRYMKGKKQLEKRVGKGDIRKIADAIMNDRQYADIQKELEFLSTGFEDIDADTLERVQDIFEQAQGLNFNSKERVDLENEAYKLLAMKISPKGGSFRDKLDAWRYLAMLANPTTHIKNITGNVLFGQGMVSAKNSLAALIEAGADRVSKLAGKGGIDRTKSILTPADKGLLDASAKDGLENAYRELAGNKYTSTGTAIDNAIPAFNTKTVGGKGLNKAADVNSGALNAEDEVAVLAKYRTSLAGFLKANGADESIFNATDTESKNLLESARAYAINQAKEAAFHQESATANALSQFSKNARNSDSKALKALGFASDVVIPFKKTPINILKSAIEYSPAEYVKVVADLRKLSKGRIKAADFIDDLSKATTGTVALGIGALLAHEGILKIGSSKSDEEQAFDTQTGRQNVAVKVGNKYVGLSELIPAAAPLILGGTIYETWKDSKGEENALNTIFSGMSAIAEGVTDMTMLSGIADTLNSIRYAQDNSEIWQKLGLDTASNFASQLLPTLGRKINVTADDTKRSTYSDQTGALKTIDQEAKYLQTKIPGLQQAGEAMKQSDLPVLQAVGNRLALQPNIDVKGQVQDSPGVFGENGLAGRIANNFLSPVSLTEDSSTAYDDERRRLANATGETKVLPYIASSEAKIEGVGQLSPEQWTQYRQQRGQMREGLAMALMDDKSYEGMSDPDKAELLKNIDSFTKAYTQAEYGKEMSSTNQKLADVYDEGGEDALVRRMWQSRELNNAGLNTTDNLIEFLDNGGNVDDYLKFKDKVTTINDKGKPTIRKDDFMKAVSELPKEQQELYFNTKDISLTKAEQAAYDQGGPSAAVQAWQTKQRQDEKKAREKEKKLKQAAREAGVSVEKLDDLQKELASYGASNSEKTVYYYNHAKQTIPSLTPKGYTQKLKEIGGSDYRIDQKEMITYLNKTGASQDEANKLWNAYGEWKSVPYLKKDGTWGKKNK